MHPSCSPSSGQPLDETGDDIGTALNEGIDLVKHSI